MSSRISRSVFTLPGALLLLTASAAAQSAGPAQVWSVVANSGDVDSRQQSLYQTTRSGSVQIKSGSTGSIVLRYAVTGIPAVFRRPHDPEDDGPDQRIQLMARLRDTGFGARVLVRLRALDLDSGTLTTLATIDSDVSYYSAGQPEYRNEFAYLNVDEHFQFDYWRYAYYVEAELSKSSSTANPGLMAVQICNPAGVCQEGI